MYLVGFGFRIPFWYFAFGWGVMEAFVVMVVFADIIRRVLEL